MGVKDFFCGSSNSIAALDMLRSYSRSRESAVYDNCFRNIKKGPYLANTVNFSKIPNKISSISHFIFLHRWATNFAVTEYKRIKKSFGCVPRKRYWRGENSASPRMSCIHRTNTETTCMFRVLRNSNGNRERFILVLQWGRTVVTKCTLCPHGIHVAMVVNESLLCTVKISSLLRSVATILTLF